MAISGIQAYGISKQYTKDTVIGAGALKGAPCKIKSIEKINGQNKVTFEWDADDGTTRESTMYVNDGEGEGDDEYEIVMKVEDLPTNLKSTDRKMYFVIEEDKNYFWDGSQWKPQEIGGKNTFSVTGETLIIQ